MKKLSALLLSLVLVFTAASSVYAESKAVGVTVDGQNVAFGSAAPVLEEGKTLAPIRQLFEALDLQFAWDAAAKTAKGTKDGIEITLQVGSSQATVNGKTVDLGAAPVVIGQTTYVPVRAVAEAAGFKVRWDKEAEAVVIVGAFGGSDGAAPEAEKQASRGFLWKAEKGDNTVYLLGSIHVANEQMYPLRTELQEAYDDAEHLAVELDLLAAVEDQAALQQLIMDKAAYKDGTTLKDHVSAETYEQIGKVLEALQLPADTLDPFEPWYVSLVLSQFQSAGAGLDGGIGIDAYFLGLAKEDKKPIIELESAEFQYDMLDGFSEELQMLLLEQGLAGMNEASDTSGADQMAALAEAWASGDEEALTAYIAAMNFNEEYYNAMVLNRNIAMADKIEVYLQSGNDDDYLVVVGAAHVVGEDGLAALLEARGYKVTRI